MKFYSELEKRAIDILAGSSPDMMHVQSFGTLITNLIDNEEQFIHADLATNTVSMRVTEGGVDKLLTAIDDIVAVACLIDFLESQHLIKLYDLVENTSGNPVPRRKFRYRSTLRNSDLSRWICSHWNQQIYVSHTLKEIKAANYKTVEDIHLESQAKSSKRQLTWAIWTLIATVLVQIAIFVITKWC